MIEDQLFEIMDPVLKTVGAVAEEGEEYRTPPLDVLRYYHRPVRLHWVPVLDRASSVVALVRQPVDVGFLAEDYRRFLTRLALAVNGRFPPWVWVRRRGPAVRSGLVIGLTVLVLTPEPIGAGDDAMLGQILGTLQAARTRTRAVPMGLMRINLGQEALAFALAPGPPGLFLEPEALADALTLHFRRFVPLLID